MPGSSFEKSFVFRVTRMRLSANGLEDEKQRGAFSKVRFSSLNIMVADNRFNADPRRFFALATTGRTACHCIKVATFLQLYVK